MTTTYAIVGAGIAGASIAYHLGTRTDDRIIVFEQGATASETTAKSIAQFGFYGDQTQYEMKRYGMALYNQFFADSRANPRYELAGLLTVATTESGATELEQAVSTDDTSESGKGPGTSGDRDLVEFISGDELTSRLLVPPINEDVIKGALYRPKMGYMARPAELAHEFILRAKDAGVEFRFNTPVRDIETVDDRVTAVVADDRYDVDAVVCGAGPWNVELARRVGVELPVRHTLAPVLELEPESLLEYSLPAINQYDGPHAIHRRRSDAILVGYIPEDGYDRDQQFDPADVANTVPPEIREEMLDAVERLTPRFGDAPLVDERPYLWAE